MEFTQKEALLEKLELSAQRKNDQVRQKREKAAVKNQNAKIVATRVQMDRKTNNASAEMTPASTPTKPIFLTPTFKLESGKNTFELCR